MEQDRIANLREFHNSRLLDLINKTLKLFGWAIRMDVDDLNIVRNMYPVKVEPTNLLNFQITKKD